jgi:glycosyltransferase involved in cell wall biosynthesis
MTRIAIGGISLLSPLTGIGQYTSHLTQGLLQEGVAVDLFLGHEWQSANPELFQRLNQESPTPSLFRRGFNKIKRQIPGARQTLHSMRQQSFTQGIQKIRDPSIDLYHEPNFIPWECDKPTVITIHDLSWIRHPETHPHDRVEWLNQHILRAIDRADQIITISDFVTKEIKDVFGEHLSSKITRIYNGVSEVYQTYDPKLHQQTLNNYGLEKNQYFLALGTLEPRKNLATIVHSYARLPQSIQSRFPLVIAGHRGWLNHELDQALTLVPQQHIRLLGYLPQHGVPAITAGASALVYASHYEGFGLPPLEAMACGVPVISSNASAMKEVVGEAGMIIDTQDIEGFTSAMQVIVENHQKAQHYREAGLKRAQDFSWERCAHETLACYQTILNS